MSDFVDKAEAWDAAAAVPPKARAEIERLRAEIARLHGRLLDIDRMMDNGMGFLAMAALNEMVVEIKSSAAQHSGG